MVYNQTNRNILFFVCLVYSMRKFTNLIPQVLHRIHIKNGIHILHNNSQTLQTHTGINIFLLQQLIITFAIVLKLGKYIIPDLNIPVTVTSYCTSRLSAAILFSTVIINLGTRSARSRAMLPEVVLFPKTENALLWNSYLLMPDIPRLVILKINRRIQTLRIKSHNLCQKLPGPADCLFFEVIPKREIAQHLKKRAVARCFSDIFDISGTNTLLARSHSTLWRNLRPCKIWLQRRHTCIDQKQTVVVVRHQRKAVHHQMIFAFEKVEIHFS